MLNVKLVYSIFLIKMKRGLHFCYLYKLIKSICQPFLSLLVHFKYFQNDCLSILGQIKTDKHATRPQRGRLTKKKEGKRGKQMGESKIPKKKKRKMDPPKKIRSDGRKSQNPKNIKIGRASCRERVFRAV